MSRRAPAPPPGLLFRLTRIQARLAADAFASHSRRLAAAARRTDGARATGLAAEAILSQHMAVIVAKALRRRP